MSTQRELSDAAEKADCEKALLALAGWYPTPVEGYGFNTSWAISDLCRAIQQLRAAAPSLHKEPATPLEVHRNVAKAQIRKMGFVPSEEIVQPWDGKHGSLQWEWRKAGCQRDPSEIIWAVIDGLTQEGIAAWPGDATSIVEQIVRVQYDRAEAALAALHKEGAGEHELFLAWWQEQQFRTTYTESIMGACEAAWNAALLRATSPGQRRYFSDGKCEMCKVAASPAGRVEQEPK